MFTFEARHALTRKGVKALSTVLQTWGRYNEQLETCQKTVRDERAGACLYLTSQLFAETNVRAPAEQHDTDNACQKQFP